MSDGRAVLNKLRNMQQKLESMKERASSLRDSAAGVPSQFGDTHASGTTTGSKIESCIVQAVDLDRRISMMQARYDEYHAEVVAALRSMDNKDERRLLELRYVDQCQWAVIMSKMGVTKSKCHRLHKRAVKNFEAKWNAKLDVKLDPR